MSASSRLPVTHRGSRTRRFTRCALTVALATASCATPPTQLSTTNAWLERFADAIKFLPAGMQSHWFSDYRGWPSGDGKSTIQHLALSCGRDFQPPTLLGAGPYEGVDVEDYGSRGVPAERLANLGEPRPSIAGASVWVQLPKARQAGYAHAWIAIVAERFVVSASSETLLREALAQGGTLRFGSLEPLPEIAPTTVNLVVRDLEGTPYPQNLPLQLNVTGVSAIAAFDSSLFHARVWGRDAKQLAALTQFCFSEFHGFRASPSVDGAGWHTLAITREPADVTLEERHLDDWLRSFMWFGAWIFI